MLPKCSIIAIASLLSYSTLASADTPPPATPTAPAKPSAPSVNEKVCADIIVTGSRIAKQRICATRSEWAAMEQEDKDLVNQVQRSAKFGCEVINIHTGTPAC